MKIKINQETLTALSGLYRFSIHGDCVKGENVEWDLEFPDMFRAAQFARDVADDDGVVRVDIRQGDKINTLHSNVVLTLVVDRVTAW